MNKKGNDVKCNSKKFDSYRWLIIILLVLCVLGLSLIPSGHAGVATKDVEPTFTGCEACSAKITNFVVNEGAVTVVVTPVTGPHNVPVYLVPNGDVYAVSWTANSDLLGLATPQTSVNTFTAGTDCQINTPSITVCSTVQATPQN